MFFLPCQIGRPDAIFFPNYRRKEENLMEAAFFAVATRSFHRENERAARDLRAILFAGRFLKMAFRTRQAPCPHKGIGFPGAPAPVVQVLVACIPRWNGEMKIRGERFDIRVIHPPQVRNYFSKSSPSCHSRPDPARCSRSSFTATGGNRSKAGSRGGLPKTMARSTTVCLAMAKVIAAWDRHGPCDPEMINALVSRIVVRAASQDWLSCCERKWASTG